MELLYWDVYEIQTRSTPIHGVKLRGRIRALCIENNMNVLVENSVDGDNRVRFAIISGEDPSLIVDYLTRIIHDVSITKILENVPNPVLSKIKVNDASRYSV